MADKRTAVITGASSGIGEALALALSAKGMDLGLIARDPLRLEAVADRCREAGSKVVTAVLDVRDRSTIAAWMEEIDGASRVDLVIANAGVIGGAEKIGLLEDNSEANRVFETNVLGVVNTVQPLLKSMMSRGRGQIAIISSIAAFVPLAHAPSYSASKAAILNYGLSLRDALRSRGVKVSVACPGFVDTPMSRSEKGPKPFLIDTNRAAAEILDGLEADRDIIMFPKAFAWATRISGMLPAWMRRLLSRRYQFSVSKR